MFQGLQLYEKTLPDPVEIAVVTGSARGDTAAGRKVGAETEEVLNRMFSGDQSLNVQVGDEGDTEWQDMLIDSNDTQDNILANTNELKFRKKIFNQALEILNEREKEIIKLRKLKDKPVKLEELSKKFNISRERVRQIEVKAFEKLKKQVSTIIQ